MELNQQIMIRMTKKMVQDVDRYRQALLQQNPGVSVSRADTVRMIDKALRPHAKHN
jgi:hypothetical protein